MKNVALLRTLLLSYIVEHELTTTPAEAAIIAAHWSPNAKDFYLHHTTTAVMFPDIARKDNSRRTMLHSVAEGRVVRRIDDKTSRWELVPAHRELFDLYCEQMEHVLGSDFMVPAVPKVQLELGNKEAVDTLQWGTSEADVVEFTDWEPGERLELAGVEHQIQLLAFVNSMPYQNLNELELAIAFMRRMDLLTGRSKMTLAEVADAAGIGIKTARNKVAALRSTGLWEGKVRTNKELTVGDNIVADVELWITDRGAAELQNFLRNH